MANSNIMRANLCVRQHIFTYSDEKKNDSIIEWNVTQAKNCPSKDEKSAHFLYCISIIRLEYEIANQKLKSPYISLHSNLCISSRHSPNRRHNSKFVAMQKRIRREKNIFFFVVKSSPTKCSKL